MLDERPEKALALRHASTSHSSRYSGIEWRGVWLMNRLGVPLPVDRKMKEAGELSSLLETFYVSHGVALQSTNLRSRHLRP